VIHSSRCPPILSTWPKKGSKPNLLFFLEGQFELGLNVVSLWLLVWDQAGVSAQLGKLWDAVRQPSIYLPVAFLFLWQGTPTSDSAFFYFLTNEVREG
jgi:hypothetical protein